MTFSLESINRSEIFNNGGYEIIISGIFEQGYSYNIFIGDYKNDSDAICYSGIPEQGNTIYPELNNTLYVYTPLLNITGSDPYSITVINVVTLESKTLLNCLYVRNKQFNSKVYSYKKNLFNKYEVGPIDIMDEK
jgi:hypothetical protein